MGNFDNYYKDHYGNEHRDIPLGTSPADAYVRTNMKFKKEVQRIDNNIQETNEHIDAEISRVDEAVSRAADGASSQLESAVNDINETIGELSDIIDTRITALTATVNSRVDNIIAHNNDTESNSELIDMRNGVDGTVYESAGSAVRTQHNILTNNLSNLNLTYIISDSPLPDTSNEFEINLHPCETADLYISFHNNDNDDGYVSSECVGENKSAEKDGFIQSFLLTAGQTQTFQVPQKFFAKKILVSNTNHRNISFSLFYSYKSSIINTIGKTVDLNHEIAEKEAAYFSGYIDADGIPRSSDSFRFAELKVKYGEYILFTGGYGGWSPLIGLTENHEVIQLLPRGQYLNKTLKITNQDIIMVRGFASVSDTLSLKRFPLNQSSAMDNKNIQLSDFHTITAQSGVSISSNDGNELVYNTGTSSAGMVNITNGGEWNSNDFILVAFDVFSDTDIDVFRTVLYPIATEQVLSSFRVEANKPLRIYMRSNSIRNAGTINVQFQALNTENAEIHISNLNVVKNKETITINNETKRFTHTLTVSRSGEGDFADIQQAIDYAKRRFDVLNEKITIFVKNGYYKVTPINGYPYSPINKGYNKISIIGESRDGVVIECYNTENKQNKVMDIGGECTIANITIRSLNDGSYNISNDLGHNCYCIHNDTGAGAAVSAHYYTTVENCQLYSECHSPVGAGLHDNQTQRYVNCEFISNGIKSLGALYIHSSVEDYANNMSVEIENCSCISKDETYALNLPNVASSYGSVPYSEIPVSIKRSIVVTNGENITNVSQSTHLITADSCMNNNDNLNYHN